MRLSSTVILQRNGEVLLIKRKYAPFKGCWALVGGAKRRDETFLECAVRETREETGIFFRVFTRVEELTVDNELGAQFSEVYVARLKDEDLPALRLGKEVDEAKLFPHTCLPQPIVSFHKEAIERYFGVISE
jgi:8-oxo-dGTP diphosphatase